MTDLKIVFAINTKNKSVASYSYCYVGDNFTMISEFTQTGFFVISLTTAD